MYFATISLTPGSGGPTVAGANAPHGAAPQEKGLVMTDERKDERKSPPQEKQQTEEQRDPEKLQDLDIRVEESKDITGGNTRVIHG